MNTQLEGRKNQTHGVPSRVTIPISVPQVVYTRPIMMTQGNKSMGWPPLIIINYERQIIGLVVNLGTWVLAVRPYQSTLKHLNNKKYANPNVHAKVFNVVVTTNGKNLRNT
jgi:hypothetical protein